MDEGKDWVIVRQEVLRPAVFMSHVKETVFMLLRVLSILKDFGYRNAMTRFLFSNCYK